MPNFSQFPRSLAERTRGAALGAAPALIAHPDWKSPAPLVLWLHGRTVTKEIDSGRYLRLIRAGIAVCAIDLPGHGERYDEELLAPRRTLDLLALTVREIDGVVEALEGPDYSGLLDLSRLAIGGMSAGGMATLRRLCDPHRFRCAAVEASTGWLEGLYTTTRAEPDAMTRAPWAVTQDLTRVRELDPVRHLGGFAPLPLLSLHSEADSIVPYAGMRYFIERLREHYTSRGADPALVRSVTWPRTGAPGEHAGFGLAANDAKNTLVSFYEEHLHPSRPTQEF
ncbi:MAG: alpha/beta hydrolase family protein [Phycisphaerales bacterium]